MQLQTTGIILCYNILCLLCSCTGGIDSILVVTGIDVIFLLHLYKKISKQITIFIL